MTTPDPSLSTEPDERDNPANWPDGAPWLSTGQKPLDPKPWVNDYGDRHATQRLAVPGISRGSDRFLPEPQYSQDLSAYENGAK